MIFLPLKTFHLRANEVSLKFNQSKVNKVSAREGRNAYKGSCKILKTNFSLTKRLAFRCSFDTVPPHDYRTWETQMFQGSRTDMAARAKGRTAQSKESPVRMCKGEGRYNPTFPLISERRGRRPRGSSRPQKGCVRTQRPERGEPRLRRVWLSEALHRPPTPRSPARSRTRETTAAPLLRGRELRLRPGHEIAQDTGRPHSPWLRLCSPNSTQHGVHPSPEAAANSTRLPESNADTTCKNKLSRHRRRSEHSGGGREKGRKTVVKAESRRGGKVAQAESTLRTRLRIGWWVGGSSPYCAQRWGFPVFFICWWAEEIWESFQGRIWVWKRVRKYWIAILRTLSFPYFSGPSFAIYFVFNFQRQWYL